jgi:GH15 family glucan-1,4-alpha-glucosidase
MSGRIGLASARADGLAAGSVALILRHQAPSGAYPASPNFPVYRFSWLRDGAFIADAMSRAGERASAEAFFGWCAHVIEPRAGQINRLVERQTVGEPIDLGEFLHTRYTLAGTEADEEWWNHQLDGYGAWLWALGAHTARGQSDGTFARFTPAVEATARYLVAFWDRPCYDTWEEHGDRVHIATLAAIAAGLRVAAERPGIARQLADAAANAARQIERRVRTEAVRDGHLVKWLGGADLDANLLFCALPFGLFGPDDPLMDATVAALQSSGLAHGGVHRHHADVFYGGGEWVLLAALLGSYFVATGDLDDAEAQQAWVVAQGDADGQLPEQVSEHLLHPQSLAEWVARWGPVARPLLWSHAMFLNLYHDLRAAR